MSYENPITVVDTESAKIRAAGMASFGQSIAGGITALGQRQRQEAKDTKKANKEFLNSQTKYNEEYQAKSWGATDEFKEDAGFDISPQVTEVFNQWATEGARLKAERDRSDDPEVRKQLSAQIAVYDKFFLGGGMTNNLESFAELQNSIQTTGGPGKAGNVGGLSLSSTDQAVYKDFMGLGKGNGGKNLKIKGLGGKFNSETGQYNALSLEAFFGDAEKGYNMSSLGNDLITIPDMQDGTVDVLEKAGYTSGNKLNINSKGFKDFIKTNKKGIPEYTTGYDTNGNEVRYQKLDFDAMQNSLDPTFQATIVGYTNEGSVSGGDSSVGLRTMQAYIDDELEEMSDSDKEIFKEYVGVNPEDITLNIGNEKNTILDKESLDLYKKALTAQKFIELQGKMPGEPADEINEEEKEEIIETLGDKLYKEINSIKINQAKKVFNEGGRGPITESKSIRSANVKKHKDFLAKKLPNTVQLKTREELLAIRKGQLKNATGVEKTNLEARIDRLEKTKNELFTWKDQEAEPITAYDPYNNLSLGNILTTYGDYGQTVNNKLRLNASDDFSDLKE